MHYFRIIYQTSNSAAVPRRARIEQQPFFPTALQISAAKSFLKAASRLRGKQLYVRKKIENNKPVYWQHCTNMFDLYSVTKDVISSVNDPGTAITRSPARGPETDVKAKLDAK